MFIADEQNLLDQVLGYPDSSVFPMLASIDRYGNTTFNRLQIDRLLVEWKSLFDRAMTPRQEALLQSIGELIEKARDGVHLYVVFIGD